MVQLEGTARVQALSQRVGMRPSRAVCRPMWLEVREQGASRRDEVGGDERGQYLICDGEFDLILHVTPTLNSFSSLEVSHFSSPNSVN